MLASPVHRAIWQRLEPSGQLVTNGEARARARENEAAKRELGLPAQEHVLRVLSPGLRELWPVAAPTALLLGATVALAGWPGFVCLGLGLGGLAWLVHARHARRVILTSHRVLARRGGAWAVIRSGVPCASALTPSASRGRGRPPTGPCPPASQESPSPDGGPGPSAPEEECPGETPGALLAS
jgi:hypothetical protein